MDANIIFSKPHDDDPAAIPAHDNPPIIQTGADSNSEIAFQMAALIEKYKRKIKHGNDLSTPIHVDEIASKVAKLYELLRKVIDWKEDNLLRRNATERMLKRMLMTKAAGTPIPSKVDVSEVAELVVTGLIRGGHLPNDEVPGESIDRVAKALNKYVYFLEHAPVNTKDPLILKTQINFFTFIIELASCEIEEILTDTTKEDGLIMVMTQLLYERIRVTPPSSLTDEEKRVQIFIAVCRTLYDLDDAYIAYHIFKFRYPQWTDPTPEFMNQITPTILSLWYAFQDELDHPLGKEFYAIAERIDTVFTVLDDFLSDYKSRPDEIMNVISDKQKFSSLITGYYDKRYQTLKKRLFRLAVFSTLSVFVSNWATFFIVEVPLAKLFYEGFNWFTAAVDFFVPTIAMFILVAIIRPPGMENVKKVLNAMFSFVYTDTHKDLYEIKTNKRKRPVFQIAVSVIYFLFTIASFAAVAWVFYIAGLPVTSIIFDTATIGMNIFAAVMIRNKAKELEVDDKTSVWEFFLDMLSVPVAKIGSYLANKWKEYNIVAVFMTFLIETPFAIILDFIEHWSTFLKERKAELH